MTEETDASVGVRPERRAFLDAAFSEHIEAEVQGDIPAIVETFAEGGHLNFNGMLFDTPEMLSMFHTLLGFGGEGLIAGVENTITGRFYTQDALIIEYVTRGVIAMDLGQMRAGTKVEVPNCVIYQFDAAGKLASERAYLDTGALLPFPVLPSLMPTS
ncbi:hypothetical protein RHODOSMS8_02516 [Rhodobiaceae bacterium]|nr:hypothetical protein RHODOSMS8_02516 [Rhodobiaceae bacterium]